MSYFVYSQSIGEEWWEISIIFLVLISTKGTEESSALGSIIIDLIKTCSFCTQINFYVIRWWCMGSQFDLLDAEIVILLSKYTNSMTVSEYICINVCWPIIQWWHRINLITYPSVLDLFYYILLVFSVHVCVYAVSSMHAYIHIWHILRLIAYSQTTSISPVINMMCCYATIESENSCISQCYFFPLYPTRNKVYLILSYLSISAFPPESRTRKAANFPSIWY